MIDLPTLLVLGAIFLAVVLLIEGVYLYVRDVAAPRARTRRRLRAMEAGRFQDKVEESLRRHQEAYDATLAGRVLAYLDGKLSQAGMIVAPERLLLLMGVATAAIALLLPLLLGIAGLLHSFAALAPLLLAAVLLGCGVPLAFVNYRAMKRIAKFEAQFPVALDIFVRGLRAGHPVSSALQLLVEEMADPLGTEFAMVVSEISYGAPLRDALVGLADRIRTSDIRMFAVCIAIQAETGGSLADVLADLSKLVRERHSMVLKVRALASEGKMTAVVLSVLPVAAFLFVFMGQPSFYLDAVGDSWFMPGLVTMAVWYSIGVLMIRRIVSLKV